MGNRFYSRRANVAACCAFGLAIAVCAFTGAVNAATFTSETISAGDYIAGSSDQTWTISNANLAGIPPLCNGQEVTTGSYTDSVLGKGEYKSISSLSNRDLILQKSQKDLSLKTGMYLESLYYSDMIAPGNGTSACSVGGTENATGNNEIAHWQSSTFGDFKYQSIGGLSIGDTVIPDSLEMTAQAYGNGGSSMSFSSLSETGLGNTTQIGYTNLIRESTTAGGDSFTLGKSVKWTSFKTTFDIPEVTG
jgi:hypothetical protein